MGEVRDGYYFMFEIGWFLDLLIPTLVRIKNGALHLVGSKPYNAKDLKPCCIPPGGTQECKKYSLEDPTLKAFKCIDSLIAIHDLKDLEGELSKSLEDGGIRATYLNTPAKKQREAIVERVVNDFYILFSLEL